MILSSPSLFFPKVILITSIIFQILLGLLTIGLFSIMIVGLVHSDAGSPLILARWITGILSMGLIFVIYKYKKFGMILSGIYVITGILLSYNEIFRELVKLPPPPF